MGDPFFNADSRTREARAAEQFGQARGPDSTDRGDSMSFDEARGSVEKQKGEGAGDFNDRVNDFADSGFDDFYKYQAHKGANNGSVDHGVHDAQEQTQPGDTGVINVIICVNGDPFNATIRGAIGREIEE